MLLVCVSAMLSAVFDQGSPLMTDNANRSITNTLLVKHVKNENKMLHFSYSTHLAHFMSPSTQKKNSWIDTKHKTDIKIKQAGAELGQAQLKLGLGFISTIDSK